MKLTPKQSKELSGLLRAIVAQRDGFKCLRCGKTDRLQLSHIYPKGQYRRMEFDHENVKLLCVGCHLYWWHKNPLEAWEWLRSTLDPQRVERLKLRARHVDKTPFIFGIHKVFLENTLARLRKVETRDFDI